MWLDHASASPDVPDPPVAPDDPLRLTCCPDCGYSLEALPPEGICPECGFAYDRSQIVLYQGVEREDGKAERSRRLGWIAGFFGPPVVYLLQALWTGQWIGIWVYVAVLCWLALMVHLGRGYPGPRELRLFPEGFATRDGFGRAKLRWWADYPRMSISKGTAHPDNRFTYHLSIPNRPFLGVTWTDAVDFRYTCTPETADRIWARVEQWRQTALERCCLRKAARRRLTMW